MRLVGLHPRAARHGRSPRRAPATATRRHQEFEKMMMERQTAMKWVGLHRRGLRAVEPRPCGLGRGADRTRRHDRNRPLRLHRPRHQPDRRADGRAGGPVAGAADGAEVELVSDSQYVLKGLTEWRAGWERSGFRNSKGEPVANLALWKRLFAVADARRVTTRWVRGHNGDLRNERADALANKALALRSSSPR